MADKDYLLNIGQRVKNQKGVDVILEESISDHKKKRIDREEERESAAHAAEIAKYDKEKAAADAAAAAQTAGPDFKVEGGIKINIDPAAEAARAAAAAKEAQEKSDTAVQAANERADKANQDLALQRYESLKGEFQQTKDALLELTKKAQHGDDTDPLEKALKQLETLAPRLGFAKLEAGVTGGDDPKITLEITKMNIDEGQRQREFDWKMEQDRRNYDRQLKRDDNEVDLRRAEIAQKGKQFEAIAAAPAIIGKALADGIREKGSAVTKQKGEESPKVDQKRAVAAKPGEFGTYPCPECQQPVAIGPTATHVECANCGYRSAVKRDGGGEPPV